MAFSPDVFVKPGALVWCLSFKVLAASVGFELDSGDKVVIYHLCITKLTLVIQRWYITVLSNWGINVSH